ncbi:MAG: ABC transporter permease [Bdellovibrionales bacterium]|nr:ABC transporter permease [Bdellovibrionales bacterium]
MKNLDRNPRTDLIKRFYKHRMASFGMGMVVLFLLLAVMAPAISWLYGVSPDQQNVFNRYASVWSSGATRNAFSREPDAAAVLHVLGTDELGRDVLMRLLYGTQISIGIGLAVGLISALFGILIGAVAGYWGGWVDSALMRLTDSMLSLPIIPVLIVLAALDFTKVEFLNRIITSENESVIKMVFILCLFSWMTVARLVRGKILSVKQMDYVAAARGLGASHSRILFLHILPNTVGPLLVAVSLIIGQAILIEAGLSYLGLGVQPPTPSWGNMLFNAQELIYEAPLLAFFPGVMIFLAVISFNFIGDGLQLALNPKADQ